jgi:protein pelota
LKILKINRKKGFAKVIPENLDDLWHLYNVILEKDTVYAKTTRLVKLDKNYARPQKGKRVSLLLGVKVMKVLWDKSLNRLRVHGIICEAPEDLNVTGSHHTINVTLNTPITVVKSKWPKHQIDRLYRASRTKTAPIIVVSMDNDEYCVAVLRQYGVDVKVEKEIKLPGKREAEKRTKAKQEFFKTALQFLKEVWMNSRSPIAVIGPGFVKNEFVKYMKKEVSEVADAVIDVKGVNSSGLAGIREALRSGVLSKALKHVRIVEETKVMEEVLERLGKEKLDVTYGLDDVKKAGMFGAIEKLLLADITLRETPDENRNTLEKLMKEVEEKGGHIIVISTEHEAGEKLLALGGVAALLRFPLG